MRIHHITNSYALDSGGAERLVRRLHQGLLDSGVDSRLLGLEARGDHVERRAFSLDLSTPYHPQALFRLWSYARNNISPQDIVHAHLFPAVLYVSLLKMLGIIRAATVMTEHSTHNHRRRHIVGAFIDKFTYAGFERIYAISEGVERSLCAWKPALAPRTAIVLNGIQPNFCEPLVRPNADSLIILSVGNLRDAKNYPTMLRAFASLNTNAIEYWIAGEGPDRAQLQKLSEELGIEQKVRLLGHVAPLAPLLKEADIFLMASRWEGFGLAAVEAMNASLPCVISDIPGLSELDEPDQSCTIRVNPDSEESIAGALQRLLASADLRRELGSRAFRRSGRFTEARMIKSYLDEYDALSKL